MRRRGDVVGLANFAAPLEVAAWTRRHGLSPLRLAPDIAALAGEPPRVPLVGLYGARDDVVPPDPDAAASDAVEVVGEGHACCWERHAAAAAARLGRLEARPAGGVR